MWHHDVGSLRSHLLWQFITKLFETLQVFVLRSEDAHALIGLSSRHLYQLFLFSNIVVQVWWVLEKIPCGRNSSYSFPPVNFKLSILVLHGLKMCVWVILPLFLSFYSLFYFVFTLTNKYLEKIHCGRNSSLSFLPIILKPCIFVLHGDVRVVLGLSSYYMDLKLTTLY